MKMSFLERLLLAVTGILGVFFAAALGVIAYARNQLEIRLGDYILNLEHGVLWVVLIGVIALIALIWGLKLLSLAFKREPKLDRSSVSVQHTENGSVRISVAAMDTLVKQAIAHDEGVVDIKTSIINHEDSISVSIDMTLASDVHIPNVTMTMQRSIKNFIEEFSGIAVREVSIVVSKIIEVTPQPPLHLSKPEPARVLAESSQPKLSQTLPAEPQPEPVFEPTVVTEPLDAPQPEAERDAPLDIPETPAEPETVPETAAPGEVNEKDVW